MNRRLGILLCAGLMAMGTAGAALAQGEGAFFKGKEITVLIGTGPGTTYDLYARLLARHMGRHIPGEPKLIPSNKVGAGSLNAINGLYNTSPRDGTHIGTGHRFIPIMPLFGMAGTQFDALKFQYIGSMGRESGVCVSRKDANFKSIDDVKKREVRVGTTGAGSELTTFAQTLTATLGLKLVTIRGYPAATAIDLAIEQNEIQGRCGVSWGSLKAAKPQWLKDDFIDIWVQLGLSKEPDLPNVPLIGDLVSDRTDKRAIELMLAPSEMARPFLAPPDVPKLRIEVLRAAFDAAMSDPALLEEARKQGVEITPMTGAKIEALLAGVYSAPADVIERARKLVGSNM